MGQQPFAEFSFLWWLWAWIFYISLFSIFLSFLSSHFSMNCISIFYNNPVENYETGIFKCFQFLVTRTGSDISIRQAQTPYFLLYSARFAS